MTIIDSNDKETYSLNSSHFSVNRDKLRIFVCNYASPTDNERFVVDVIIQVTTASSTTDRPIDTIFDSLIVAFNTPQLFVAVETTDF